MNGNRRNRPSCSEFGSLPERLRAALDALSPRPQRALLAVSGGADSVALLSAWAQVREARGDEIFAATFDHGLRGASAADAAFAARMAEEAGAPCSIGRAGRDLAAVAGRSVEEAARIARYEFLTQVARERRCRWVATAHTADDQVETVLLAILRGTGLTGLAGMAPRRRLAQGLQLVRPLLNVRRSEVVAYLDAIGQVYCSDETNDDLRYTRNRLRRELLPVLRAHYNPRVDAAILRLSEQAGEAARRERRAARALLASARREGGGGAVQLDAAALTNAAPSLAAAALLALWIEEGWPRKRIGSRELQRVLHLARGVGPASCDLPDGVRVERSGAGGGCIKIARSAVGGRRLDAGAGPARVRD
jgi:tRNA(Ile)-lysidine synthase